MQARYWLAPVVLLLSNLPNSALAQSNPRIYLTPSQVVDENNSPIEGLDSALLSAVGDKPIIILTPNMDSGSGNLGEVAKKLKEGEKLVDDDPEKAIDVLKGVVDTYEASMGQVEDFEPYLQALSLLATAYLNSGYEDEFNAAVKKFSILRVNGVPKGTNEEVAAKIVKAQDKTKKAAAGTVKISASDPAFQVRVDGADMAAAKSLQLPPGLHFVVVTAPGQAPYLEKITVASSSTVQVTASLAPLSADPSGAPSTIEKASAPSQELLNFLKKGTITAETRALAVDLAKKNKADFVVLNIVARDSGQYRAYFYALRAKDAKVVELATPSYMPGPAATLSSEANGVMEGLVGVAYKFPDAKAIPAKPAIAIVAKGAVPLVSNVVDPGNPTKVNPYAVNIAALPTNGSDTVLTAPPDAMGNNPDNSTGNSGNSGNSGNGKVKYSVFNPEVPKGTKPPKEEPKDNNNNANSNTALRPDREPRPPRDPITFSEISGKWWFWPAVGVVGAGAVGSGVYFIAKPNGLDATITWP